MINYELKRPFREDTRRIEINLEASVEELKSQFTREFSKMHARLPAWTPNPITKDWLIDQLLALDWYLTYDLSTARPAEENTLYKKVSKKKVKEENPFK